MGEQLNSTALVLILHGSPREQSNAPARVIAQSPALTERYDHVILAFMECNEPSIPDAIDHCAALGMRRIIAVPYMLHTGRHMVMDIPGYLLQAAAKHLELEILLSDPIGSLPEISSSLIARANEAVAKSNFEN